MTITLPPEQMAWLEKFAQERELASADEAARALIAKAMTAEDDDFGLDLDPEWVIPLLDEAREEIARGEVVSAKEFLKELDERIEKHRVK